MPNGYRCGRLFGYPLQISVTSVGVEDANISNLVNVYPNPANEIIFISIPQQLSGEYKISIKNILGEEVAKTSAHISAAQTININCSHFTAGMYLIDMASGDINISKQIEIK